MTYVYYCPTCNEHFEVKLKGFITDEEEGKIRPCPKCRNEETYKIFTLVNVIYRGDGWGHEKNN